MHSSFLVHLKLVSPSIWITFAWERYAIWLIAMRFLVCLATVPFEKPFEINMQKKGADTQFYWWTFARKINSVLYQPLWNTQPHVYITRNEEKNWMMRITWHGSVLTHRLKDEQRNYLLIGSKVFWSANSCQNWHIARKLGWELGERDLVKCCIISMLN